MSEGGLHGDLLMQCEQETKNRRATTAASETRSSGELGESCCLLELLRSLYSLYRSLVQERGRKRNDEPLYGRR